MRKIINDGIWIASGQVLAALGQLLGLRILTEAMSPDIFGAVSLWLGVNALLTQLIGGPTMQALMRFLPEYDNKGCDAVARQAAIRQIVKIASFALPAVAMVFLYLAIFQGFSSITMLLVVMLTAVDMARNFHLAILNSLRYQKAYSLWQVQEAWLRPLLAWMAVWQFGASAELVLLSFLVASLMALVWMRHKVPESNCTDTLSHVEVMRRYWKYTLPLLPLGLLGWVSGMADRYIIGALLTPADVGLYVAIYGLASRPMLMYSAILEGTLRPGYQQAIIQKRWMLSKLYLLVWVGLVIIFANLALGIVYLWHDIIAGFLLADEYRQASYLMAWIVSGHVFLLLSHIANRICYAHGATMYIFLVEFVGAITAVLFSYMFVSTFGLEGAAKAVCIYFFVRLIISLAFAYLVTKHDVRAKQ